ncbi:MAG TPA: amino acid racemase [Woeseiaceae bacterium]|nr:amino acid racemase [Woeseiaceae bacterium]
MSERQLTVGVLGGMGPDATVDFMAKVIALTPAERDQDHIRMIVEHNPKVPNRQAAIRSGEPEVGRLLAQMARSLEAAGADFLVMPCNSAHAFVDPIRQAAAIPLVSIIAESVREIGRAMPGARRAGLLATDGLQEAGLYQQALVRAGHAPVLLEKEALGRLMNLINRVKAGDRSEDVGRGMQTLVDSLAARGAELVIAACTEIPLVLRAADLDVPLIASTDILARRTVELATRAAPLPTREQPEWRAPEGETGGGR